MLRRMRCAVSRAREALGSYFVTLGTLLLGGMQRGEADGGGTAGPIVAVPNERAAEMLRPAEEPPPLEDTSERPLMGSMEARRAHPNPRMAAKGYKA
jgi:hypothetical protein